jgi:hypothetical protein
MNIPGIPIALVLTLLPVPVSAQAFGDGVNDRIEIQEKLLYAYAYTYDSKNCVGFANLFTTDAVLHVTNELIGKNEIVRGCIVWQLTVVGNIKTRHNMMNIVFDRLTPRGAETRSYCLITWQQPGDAIPTVQTALTYRDVILKSDDGRWLFKERKATDVSWLAGGASPGP